MDHVSNQSPYNYIELSLNSVFLVGSIYRKMIFPCKNSVPKTERSKKKNERNQKVIINFAARSEIEIISLLFVSPFFLEMV